MTDNSNNGQQYVNDYYSDRHPSTQNILKWLVPSPGVRKQKGPVATIGNEFLDLADRIMELVEHDSPELTAGLRHLLEAKDAFVRAALDEQPGFWTDR